MNIYFWKEVTNRFQRVSTQIIRYVNLILLSFSDTVVAARYVLFFNPLFCFPTDRLKTGGLKDAAL